MAAQPARADAPRRPGRPPRSDEARAAQRSRLLEATMRAIREAGPDLSIDELAAAAGVSKPVLYDEFGGKTGLADAMAIQLVQTVEQDVLSKVTTSAGIDAEAGVRLAVATIIDIVADEPNLYAFLTRSIKATDRGLLDNALVREIHARGVILVRLVAPSLDTGSLRVLIDGLFGFMFAAVESWHATRKPSKAKLVQQLTAIVLAGIQAATADGF